MPNYRFVLVGVDGSAESDAAVVWAAREASIRDAQLRIVSACDSGYLGVWTLNRAFRRELRSYGKPLVERASELAMQILTAAKVQAAVMVAPPGRALSILSRGCDLLVVGRTGRGAVSRLLFGSTTREILTQASCPVVAVTARGAASTSHDKSKPTAPRVIVAVRDAATNAYTLRFAFEHAHRHQAELHIVHSDHDRGRGGTTDPAQLIDDVSDWQARYPAVDTKVVEVASSPAEFIADICRPDDILVVGHHRHSAWCPRRLGANLLDELHAAPCPVAVVPEFPTESNSSMQATNDRSTP
jgi:nucleotide-binding universal stress UspA family protein